MLRRWMMLCLCLLLFLPLHCAAEAPDGTLRVVFFDCGKADSALIQIGEYAMMIDTGADKDGKAIVSKLRALGVPRLDALVITHPHKDHIGGADRILESVPVELVLEGPLQGDSKQTEQLGEVLAAQGKTSTHLQAGDAFSLGEATITCMGPIREQAEEENDLSLVLRIDYQDTSFLFTGDAEREALDDLLSAYTMGGLSADVLKVPHHGGKERNSLLFFQSVSPQIAFIPCEQGTEDQLPDEEVLAALDGLSVDVYIADEGDVAIYSDGQKVWAEQDIFATGP